VFWNLHERERGVFDFSGRLDLVHCCELAQEHGLNVILRIGPYICAETNYGGFPAWLREIPGMRMRTWNEPFMREMERWVRHLTAYLHPLFAAQGGPIIAAQIENEYNLVGSSYGEAGERYIQWAADLGNALNLGIPWVMCVGGARGAIETVNGFLGHTQLERHWNDHPEQPAIWTENWPGWYDVWGVPHHLRTSEHVAYATARFFAAGGTGVNYYPWHGGTNFGREAMYLQTTSYDFNTALDEFGQPTTKYNHLRRLNRLLVEYEAVLLASGRPTPATLGPQQVAYAYGDLAFLCNDDEAAGATVQWQGRTYELAPESVLMVDGDRVRFDSAHIDPADVILRQVEPVPVPPEPFVWRAEPLPAGRPAALRNVTVADAPVNQLDLTHDQTDYCWYSTRFAGGGQSTLTLTGAADLVYIYVDGRLLAATPAPLLENRGGLNDGGFTQHFELDLPEGAHELDLLCCAVGLVKGDWQIGMQNMAEERKGIWGPVTWNGQPLPGPWRMEPGLVGEQAQYMAEAGALLRWAPLSGEAQEAAVDHVPAPGLGPLRWYRSVFDRPAGDAPLVIEMGAMTKGLCWVNGRCIGRYWQAPGVGETEFWLKPPVLDDRPGEAPQRYYHIPLAWLKPTGNVLVLFEEAGGDPTAVRLCRWV
jgi:beta-galactosidase